MKRLRSFTSYTCHHLKTHSLTRVLPRSNRHRACLSPARLDDFGVFSGTDEKPKEAHWSVKKVGLFFLQRSDLRFQQKQNSIQIATKAWAAIGWVASGFENSIRRTAMSEAKWKQRELVLIIFYAIAFYAYALRISLRLSHGKLRFHTMISRLNLSNHDLMNGNFWTF